MSALARIPASELISQSFYDFSRANALSDGALDVYLNVNGGNVAIGGGEYGNQTIRTMSMDSALQAYLQTSFERLSRIIDIDFRLSPDRQNTDLNFYLDTTIDVGGAGTTLGIALPNTRAGHSWWEIILNTPALISQTDYLHYASIHELGHVLGLEHPFDATDGDVYISSDPQLGAYPEDTVMAYRTPESGRWPEWYSLNDLEALIKLWGARTQLFTAADETIIGQDYSEIFDGAGGNDAIDGRGGRDTVIFHGASSQYDVTVQNGSVVVKDNVHGRDGVDTLVNVEHVKFTDGVVAADVPVTADNALIYRLYQAAFARMPDEDGLRFWIGAHNNGQSITAVADYFLGSPEFSQKYGGALTNSQYIDLLYQNILGRAGDANGLAFWNGLLDNGGATKSAALIGFAGSPENVLNTAAHIDHGFFIA